ncbi:MUC16 protein, partial [Polypterus senegalus]
MQPNSLYVNNYPKQPAVIPTVNTSTVSTTRSTVPPTISTSFSTSANTSENTIHFSISFNLINLPFNEQLTNKSSPVPQNITHLVTQVLQNSSLSSELSSCQLNSFSHGPNNSTAVNITCQFKNDTASMNLDRVAIYEHLNNRTQNSRALGPYNMDPNSLYVNGYHPIQPVPAPSLVYFMINFTLTNVNLTDELSNKSSPASNNITLLVTKIFQNSSWSQEFSSCQPANFSHGTNNSTEVQLRCKFKNDTSLKNLNKVVVYDLVNNETHNSRALGPYTMDPNSLYVNGYHKLPTSESLANFTVNFTLTNLSFTAALTNKSSPVAKNVSLMFTNVLQTSSLSPEFSSCQPATFSPGMNNSTAVQLTCTFKKNTSLNLDRVVVYQQISNGTQNSTALGPYSMDPNSLYVNGYHAIVPTPPPSPVYFTINFTLTNLNFTDNLNNKSSLVSNNIKSLMANVLQNSNLTSELSSCQPASFSHGPSNSTKVLLSCTFKNNTLQMNPDRVAVYEAINNGTNGSTALGPYSMDPNSLYVNGYHPVVPTPTPSPVYFTINFTLTNLNFTDNLNNKSSLVSNNIKSLMANVLQNSNLTSELSSCQPASFSHGPSNSTKVLLSCTFKNNTLQMNPDRVAVYEAINNGTNGSTALGPYSIDPNSLYVNGYHEVLPAPTLSPVYFTINFTLTNLSFSGELSNKSNPVVNTITSLVSNMLQNSSLSPGI